MTELQITYRPVDDLVPYARNARTHTPEQIDRIAASIREYGWTNPILTDGEAGIIAGHGRLAAARKLGLQTVPTIELSGLSEAQKRAYILADNRLALDAGWDEELLKIELQDLQTCGVDIDVTGFTNEELDSLLPTDASDEEEESETPEIEGEPVSKPGDVWICGKHRVMCGDACSASDIQTLTGETKASLYLTDPPYNVSYEGSTADALTIMNDSMEDGKFRQFLIDAFSMADSVMKPGAPFYIWHADSEGFNFRGACRDVGWKVRQCLVWNKNALVIGRQDYQWKHEPCLYGWKGGAHIHGFLIDHKQRSLTTTNLKETGFTQR